MTEQSGERRLLIDGKLVDSESGKTFDNVNPATEEVLGVVADGTRADMEAAVAAARRAFDTTVVVHRPRLPQAVPLPAAGRPRVARRRSCAPSWSPRSAAPLLLTYGPQLDAPLREALTWPAEQIETFPWARSLGPKDAFGMGHDRARGVEGADRRRRRDRAVELPDRDHPQQARPDPRHGQHLRAQAGARHAVERHPHRPPHRREDRHPAGRREHRRVGSDHLVGEVLTTSPDVDMVAFTGSTATGQRIMAAAAATLKPVFLELGGKSVNLVLDDADLAAAPCRWPARCASTPARAAPSPPGSWCRGSMYDEAVELAAEAFAGVTYGDPTDANNLMGPLVSAAPARAGARLHREGQGGGRPARVRRRRPRRTCPRAGSWSRRSSPTSTTR